MAEPPWSRARLAGQGRGWLRPLPYNLPRQGPVMPLEPLCQWNFSLGHLLPELRAFPAHSPPPSTNPGQEEGPRVWTGGGFYVTQAMSAEAQGQGVSSVRAAPGRRGESPACPAPRHLAFVHSSWLGAPACRWGHFCKAL